jgi:membrane protease YdiL (CAAX protease family)
MSSAVTLDGQEIKIVPEGSVAGPIHTVVLIVMLFGGAGLMYFSSGRAHGIGQPNRVSFYLTTMAWEWFLTGYVLWGVRRYGKSLLEITGARWMNVKEVFRDIGVALAFWMVALMVLGLVASLLHFQGSRQALSALAPEGPAQIFVWIVLCITAGFCEETIFRGYLQKQFVTWIGNVPLGIFLSAAIFGICQIYQGTKAVVVITVYGLLFGILAQWRKSMRPGMMTHALHDTVSGLAVSFLPR